MYSPFYSAEQKRLYPHRKICNTSKEVASHYKRLNKKGVIELETLRNTPICDLMLNYFMGVHCDQILEGIDIIKKQQNTTA